MGSKFILGTTFFLFLISFSIKARAADFDIKKYGAKADGKTDDSQAINSAWKEACASTTPSTVVIAKGNYMAGPVKFQG
ncbi:polygalacturonase-like, partial [Prunus avium]|uniref:Polygalacturonase-like n=3 Tax=Prunus TaxID=3754 RepID=A0A6P5RRP9_PRUAV